MSKKKTDVTIETEFQEAKLPETDLRAIKRNLVQRGSTDLVPPDITTRNHVVYKGRVPRIDANGFEIVSPESRVVTAYLPTLGERIRRYSRNPVLQTDLYKDETLFDDPKIDIDISEDDFLMSPHEDRYKEALEEAKKRKSKRDDEEKEASIKKQKAENEAFEKRVREVIDQGKTTLKQLDLEKDTSLNSPPKE